MMNGGDPSHQVYPGQTPSMQTSSGQYQMPPTPAASNINPSSVTGNPSPHPSSNSELPPGFPPTPIPSNDMVKKEHPNPNDPSAQISIPSLPSSVKSEFKTELLSPTYPPGSITGPPQSQQQQIKTELNPSIPPLSDNIPSVPQSTGEFCTLSRVLAYCIYNSLSSCTLIAVGVPSVKRRESISEMPPSAKPAMPSIPMDTNTPRSPAVGTNWIKSDPALRKGELTKMMTQSFY